MTNEKYTKATQIIREAKKLEEYKSHFNGNVVGIVVESNGRTTQLNFKDMPDSINVKNQIVSLIKFAIMQRLISLKQQFSNL